MRSESPVSKPSVRSPLAPVMALLILAVGLAVLMPMGGGGTARAQTKVLPPDPLLLVPGFWDPRRRPERPDLSRLNVIRFLTETDYPPFNLAGPDGQPQGFNVDLAREFGLTLLGFVRGERFNVYAGGERVR